MTSKAEQAAREVEGSRAVEGLARLGFLARALVYVLIAVITLQVVGGDRARADRQGALAAIRERPFGEALLLVLAGSFAGFGLWRLLQAAVGHRDEQGRKRLLKRLMSLGKAVLYSALAVSTVQFLTSGSGDDQTRPWTARALALPGGRLLVAAVAVAAVVTGLVMGYRGLSSSCLERLDLGAASARTRSAVRVVGLAGLVGRGLVVCLLGGFLLQAAATFDAGKARGLDAALKTLAARPFGPLLLTTAAVGLLAYGAWSLVEARYRKV